MAIFSSQTRFFSDLQSNDSFPKVGYILGAACVFSSLIFASAISHHHHVFNGFSKIKSSLSNVKVNRERLKEVMNKKEREIFYHGCHFTCHA